MTNVLVTGAAGFIGSNLVHFIHQHRPAWRVTALDALTYAGNLENISSLLDSQAIEFAKVDITDEPALAELFTRQRFDLVFHLAAESHVDRSILGAAAFVKTNVVGTQNILSCCLASKVGRCIHISTDEVYGSLGPTGRFVESTPLNPTSPYAASKAASDLMAIACHRTHGFDVVITRCTNNYGAFQFPEKLIPLFITNALDGKALPLYGDGMNVRSWIHVRDHCAALLLAAESGRAGEVYNIGGSESAEIPNLEVTKQILKQLDRSENLITRVADRPAHDLRYAVDYSKIKNELGWEPAVDFATGLSETIRWYVEHRPWWERVKSGDYLSYYQQNYGSRK